MPDSVAQLNALSTLAPRQQIRTFQTERRSLESKLLQPQSMLPASLLERFLRDGGSARATPAYYLSRSVKGRSKLTYVSKEELGDVRRRCIAYRTYQQNLKQWRRVTAALEQLWRQLRQSQSE